MTVENTLPIVWRPFWRRRAAWKRDVGSVTGFQSALIWYGIGYNMVRLCWRKAERSYGVNHFKFEIRNLFLEIHLNKLHSAQIEPITPTVSFVDKNSDGVLQDH